MLEISEEQEDSGLPWRQYDSHCSAKLMQDLCFTWLSHLSSTDGQWLAFSLPTKISDAFNSTTLFYCKSFPADILLFLVIDVVLFWPSTGIQQLPSGMTDGIVSSLSSVLLTARMSKSILISQSVVLGKLKFKCLFTLHLCYVLSLWSDIFVKSQLQVTLSLCVIVV